MSVRAMRKSAGTIAVPPGGSASINSLLARTTPSSVPTFSRCTGPMFVITPMCGRVNAHSSAIWPKPRMASSRMAISVSLLDAADGQRHADLRVVASLRRDRPRLQRTNRGEDVLRRRLSHRARDRDEARAAPLANGAARSRRALRTDPRARASQPHHARTRACGSPTPSPIATNRSPSSMRRESTCMPVISSVHPARSHCPGTRSAAMSRASGITPAATRAAARAPRLCRRTGTRVPAIS